MNKIKENISLKPYNTFGVEAKTRYFVEIHSTEELKQQLEYFRKEHPSLPLLLLGGGSNILLTKDFEGLTLKLNLKGLSEARTTDNTVLITAQAGENWHEFVLHCIEKNYGGLENLALIPGNVGTSPMQNIGAYGVEIKDVMHSCKALNLETLEIETFTNAQCQFGYRDSFFKQKGKGKYIITEVTFCLTTKNHKIQTEYGAIRHELEQMKITSPSIQDIAKAVIKIRESKLPNPLLIGNAGSFFKNPTVSQAFFKNLQHLHPNIPHYPTGEQIKIPAGWLIEQCGWKGRQIGNVAAHPLQALVLTNATGKASGQEVYDYSSEIIQSVHEKFGIELEREVNIL
ncbi:UDP-N-acetylmuramate dehydrogenase [Bergeyella sp. RCAD1439]|uniref:UDP-N-acetylmuramate dehydrogenase n=1 Tax=Bergeyella anatis TaxID=3113737 RepID=UPI002E197667|nr:UDP-N-acetylmuramate dehydrogenase [Bergeyella sp. RCAD1439]